MQRRSMADDLFYWPERSDIEWLKPEEILCIIDPPTPTGRRAANYIFDVENIRCAMRLII